MKSQLKGTKAIQLKYEDDQLPYILIKKYNPDFTIVFPNGKKRYIESKGYFRPTDRTKMLAVKRFDPTLDIRMVFAKDNTLSKNSKTRYSDWCKKNGFPYAIGQIPKGWMKENG